MIEAGDTGNEAAIEANDEEKRATVEKEEKRLDLAHLQKIVTARATKNIAFPGTPLAARAIPHAAL